LKPGNDVASGGDVFFCEVSVHLVPKANIDSAVPQPTDAYIDFALIDPLQFVLKHDLTVQTAVHPQGCEEPNIHQAAAPIRRNLCSFLGSLPVQRIWHPRGLAGRRRQYRYNPLGYPSPLLSRAAILVSAWAVPGEVGASRSPKGMCAGSVVVRVANSNRFSFSSGTSQFKLQSTHRLLAAHSSRRQRPDRHRTRGLSAPASRPSGREIILEPPGHEYLESEGSNVRPWPSRIARPHRFK
jgi:hypothetical protein